jgi:hypothetical protein
MERNNKIGFQGADFYIPTDLYKSCSVKELGDEILNLKLKHPLSIEEKKQLQILQQNYANS